jgi:hypothetical protein
MKFYHDAPLSRAGQRPKALSLWSLALPRVSTR